MMPRRLIDRNRRIRKEVSSGRTMKEVGEEFGISRQPPLAAPGSVEDTTSDCATCLDTRKVPHWQPHDGRDYPDKRGWLERRLVPCPDCKRRVS